MHLCISSPLLKINHIITAFMFLLGNLRKASAVKDFSKHLTLINLTINTAHNIQVIF
jgi:hypothetical protein